MFRKFSNEENIKTASPVRSSEQRSIRAQIVQQYPALEEFVDDIFPKKESLIVCKCKDYVQMLVDQSGELIFFQCRSGPFIPTLRFLHRCKPECLELFFLLLLALVPRPPLSDTVVLLTAFLLAYLTRSSRHLAEISSRPWRHLFRALWRQHHGPRVDFAGREDG